TDAQVAPLNIRKTPSRAQSRASQHTRRSSGSRSRRTGSAKSQQGQMSPPLTPRASREAMDRKLQQQPEPVFHHYLRAFYHFHPTSTVSSSGEESSITVPINQGDVILVHSIHPNGWADGTLLASGARGWLPTNYCEAYDHDTIRTLLHALTQLWDFVRSGDGDGDDLAIFSKHDYVRGMIAGVRVFLEKTTCLKRESYLIQSHVALRRMRKGLLGDLSSFVKVSKRLQDVVLEQPSTTAVFEMLDELVLKAFKVVTRAVRFLDIWAQDVSQPEDDDALDYGLELERPPTPPGETADEVTRYPSGNDVVSPTETVETEDPGRRSRAAEPGTVQSQAPVSRPLSLPPKRFSVSHRMSYNGKATGARRQNLASGRLDAAHDSFLGFIGSYIGLHLQSRSSSELVQTTQQSVLSCQRLLAVVDEVWERDCRHSETLEQARENMAIRLRELIQATKDVFGPPEGSNGEVVFMPDQGKQLVEAATNCVRAAGECVNRTRHVIEKIGDFEFEAAEPGLSEAIFESLPKSYGVAEEHEVAAAVTVDDHSQAAPENLDEKPLPAPPTVALETKALPEPPQLSPLVTETSPLKPLIVESPVAVSVRSSRSSIPPLSQLPMPHLPQPADRNSAEHTTNNHANPENNTHRFGPSVRTDSVHVSVAETSSTSPNSVRGDEMSVISLASTRATTPDRSPSARPAESGSMLKSFESVSELHSAASEDGNVEAQLLGKTYAHELVYNKDGQIAGGSLPALVECLTTHESTPDAMFVTAFYLTFRLFTTPVDFAKALVDRFEYVDHSHEIGTPVRLRVYNIFKGWLESYWRPDSDASALDVILAFAQGSLAEVLPQAGKRLAELATKVTDVEAGAIVPRVGSSVGGKLGVVPFVPAHAPSPVVSRSQLNALRNFKNGGSQPSFLDFDPLELARQFTLIESRIFCAIQPEELLASEWTKKADSKAVNVRAMSTLSTDLANLVADTILQLEEPKKRAVVIKQWVKIAMRCLELNNYDSLMAIICSLNSSMVLRLKKTWDLVSQKTMARLDGLKAVVDVGKNYAVLRQRLQNQVAPCIPFVGIYLTDLTFVDVGNTTTRQLPGGGGGEGGSRTSGAGASSSPTATTAAATTTTTTTTVINFDKHMRTARIIGQLQRFQIPYKLTAVPEMQDWMDAQIHRVRDSDQANVQSYYRRSLLLEPREQPPRPT
ncbi:ras guanine nucleotide exchange factor domain-containing protein, partial [Lineolata rhizophorae]